MKKQKINPESIPLNIRERILLLDNLMYNIRANWDKGISKRSKDKRVIKCIKLIIEISKQTEQYGFNLYKLLETIGLYLTGVYEGRVLRADYKKGGYEGLEKLHGFYNNIEPKSAWYKKAIKKYKRN